VNGDLAFGGIGLALAVAYYLMAAAIPESQLSDTVGPQGLPKIYAVALGVLSLIQIARSLRASDIPRINLHLPRVAGMLAIGVIYIVLVPYAGYMLALTALIAATIYYQSSHKAEGRSQKAEGRSQKAEGRSQKAEGRSQKAQLKPFVVAVAGALLFWLLFVQVLGIPYPAGIWADLF
jgi:hypothetical protein